VGNVDAEGTKWTITRDGKARATVSGQKGDTVASLLATKDNHGNLILLDASQYKKWLRPVGGPKLPATDTSPLKCDEKFTIPNIAYIADTLRHPLPIPFVDFERASRQDMRWADLHGIPNGYAVKWKGQGLDVVWLTCFTMAKLKSDLGSLDLYKFVFVGHGDETNHGTLVMPNGTPELSPGTYTKYGIAAMYLYACYSGAAKDPAGIDPMQYWRSDVSMDGWFIGWSGPVDAITVVTGWGEVRTHGTR
jgi:hypothetical protein